MKPYQFLTTILLFLIISNLSAQVGINTTTPDASAALDITSTTSGFLPPRMTETQRNVISTQAAGLMVYCIDCGDNGELQHFNGTSWVNMVGGIATAGPPTSTVFIADGVSKVFLAHNLGADNSEDPDIPVQVIHGNYYQWGSSTIVANASTAGDPIVGWNITPAANGAWADGSKTENDPCPVGFRVPTKTQWQGVMDHNTASRTSNNAWVAGDTNFRSAIHWTPAGSSKKLTLPTAGYRDCSNGALRHRGNEGNYWSSTENDTYAYYLYFGSSNAKTFKNLLTYGFSVRCVSE